MLKKLKDRPGGWKTKTAAYLFGGLALVRGGVYFISGTDIEGALPPLEAIGQVVTAFAVYAGRDAIGKIEKAL